MNKREQMRAMRATGASFKEIGEKFGVTESTALNYTYDVIQSHTVATAEIVHKVKSIASTNHYRQIAKKLGLNYSMVSGIVKGKYDHLIEHGEFFSVDAYARQTQTI